MHASRLFAAMAALAVMTGLSGCRAPGTGDPGSPVGGIPGHGGSGPNEDGALCGEVRSGAVYIQVGYDASGMPVVNPDRCHVDPGTRITWRGPDNDQRAFEIAFKAASASDDGKPSVGSEYGQDRSRAKIVAKRTQGSYAYAVRANGKELDPQIIIDPR